MTESKKCSQIYSISPGNVHLNKILKDMDPITIEPSEIAKKQHEKRVPRGKVVIFGLWCKGCGLCVQFCPVGVLALDNDDHPYVAYPEKCTACHWCDTHCPDLAIVVKPLES